MKKKVCMLGSFAVGKTSLVRRFVYSIFSEKYLTTVGVKIDKKTVVVDDQSIDLMLWDLHGEDEFNEVRTSYLRGASGSFFVVDGTRRDTLDTAFKLQKRVEDTIGNIPCVLVFNKSDLEEEWEFEKQIMKDLTEEGWNILITSAKTGSGVEDAFLNLARRMLKE